MSDVLEPEAVRAAREAALTLLDRGDHAAERLIEKLVAAGHAPGPSRDAVARLAREGWLDEEALARRLAEAITRRQPAAPGFIEMKLRARLIDPDIAARVARDTASAEEVLELAVRWARERARVHGGAAPPVTVARRVAAALQRRGFDEDVVATVLDRLALAALPEMPDDAPR